MRIMLLAYTVLGIVAAPTMVAAASGGADVPVLQDSGAQTAAVFIKKETLAKTFDRPVSGMGLASLGAVRAGDDRISVDILKRVDVTAEGPVSHDVVTEIYYILDGGGVMETGSTILDPGPLLTNGKPTNPASIGPTKTGTKTTGGKTQHVETGDVVMIPPNVVHRFVSFDGSVTYMVVRVHPDYEKKN